MDADAMHSVAGRVVIVTGAGRGVGLGIARHLGRGGARVVVAEWKPALLAGASAELGVLGIEHLGIECDVSDRGSIEAMVAASLDRFGRIDAIVNNAQSFRPMAPMTEVTEDDVEVFHRSGVLGTLWAMQAVHPHMQ
ncbi:MAG: SDR family NAD(P)-dependent oxidoreductase, partial [Actinomycetota bacterium]